MKALIFVYADSQFHITGTSSIKQFSFGGGSFDKAKEVATSGDVRLEKGIYGMFTDTEKERLEIVATSGKEGADYDVLTSLLKGTWPDPQLTASSPLYTRVHERFPNLDDSHLGTFAFDDKSAR